jgi:hypothetical protein
VGIEVIVCLVILPIKYRLKFLIIIELFEVLVLLMSLSLSFKGYLRYPIVYVLSEDNTMYRRSIPLSKPINLILVIGNTVVVVSLVEVLDILTNIFAFK